ncbi:MAG TPA: hypothetical protein PKK33_06700, partial [Candidatus Cloacimonadota bacterium]|nr:hypothetical protein [Candidatus Cloacimonadota bacterium]
MYPLKKVLILIFMMSLMVPMMATLVTIGTGTSVQRQPIACWFGYERSADLYLASEIGTAGNISDLAWYSSITQTLAIPTKIYLKTTTASTITADSWANMISGATLVYDGTLTGATASSWKLVDINDYVYTSGNLFVLVECSYGSSGTGGSAG